MMIAMTEEEETAMEVEVAEAMVVAAEDVMEVETATEEAEEATEVDTEAAATGGLPHKP